MGRRRDAGLEARYARKLARLDAAGCERGFLYIHTPIITGSDCEGAGELFRVTAIDPKNPPDNYSHEKMRSGDFAYHWLIDIRHNSDPPIPGAGSAIFFRASA